MSSGYVRKHETASAKNRESNKSGEDQGLYNLLIFQSIILKPISFQEQL